MHAEFSLRLAALFSFLLALARVSGVIVFTPIPGMTAAPQAARAGLALTITAALVPAWPQAGVPSQIWSLPLAIASEFAFGVLVGITVSFILEGAQLAAQMVSLPAGFSFASTIDPSTQADSGVLLVIVQLFTGVLFFSLGLHRQVLQVLAESFDRTPSVAAFTDATVALAVVRLASGIFLTGLRLALPVLGLLILMDLTIAVMGKVHAQLNLHSLSFAAKMLIGFVMIAATLPAFPDVLGSFAGNTFQFLGRLLGH